MASSDRDFIAGDAPSGTDRARDLWRSLEAALLAERDRWPLWLPVLLGVGIGVYFWLPREPAPWLGGALAVAAAAWLARAWRQGRGIALEAALFALALGFAAAQAQAMLVAAPVLQHRLVATIEGRLESVDPLPEGARLVVAPASIEGLAPEAMPRRVRITLKRGDAAAIPGAWLQVKAVLMPPPAPAQPGAFDFERRAWFMGLGAVGYALGSPHVLAPPVGWRSPVQYVRASVTNRIRAALPGDEGAIAAALIAGDTHAIPPEDADAFRNAGLAHILVIAGLHMGMVAGIVFFAMRAGLALVPRVALYHPTKKYAAAAAALMTFGYMLLSGATVSSERAFAMIALALAAVLLDRVSLSARAVAVAASVIMLAAPESATGPSFQMSFAAVAALVACYEAMRPRLARWHAHAGLARRVGLYLAGIALTTIVTTAATMPLTVYHFNRFALYSVAANAIAVPITGFWVMPWAIVAVLAMPLHLEAPALHAMALGIDAIAAVARHVTAWPGAVMRVASMPEEALALLSLGGLWLCIWQRRWRWLGLAPIAAGVIAIGFVRPPDLMVAAESHAAAVLMPDGRYAPSSAEGAKILGNAARHAGADMTAPWPRAGPAPSDLMPSAALQCDAEACLYRTQGRIVALERDGAALAEDCRAADLVVSPVAAHRLCRGPRIIDAIDTWRRGGYAVWLDPGGIRVLTVRQWQGERPWVPRGVSGAISSAASALSASPEP